MMALPARLGSQAPVWALQGFCVQLVGTLSIVPLQEPNRLGIELIGEILQIAERIDHTRAKITANLGYVVR